LGRGSIVGTSRKEGKRNVDGETVVGVKNVKKGKNGRSQLRKTPARIPELLLDWSR